MMHWRQVVKPVPPPVATSGGYRAWKPDLAIEAEAQCVYCCIHESRFGGFRNFHVEHYRPRSRRPDLETSYANLFYACGICNSFKSDDWPADIAVGELSIAGYPDPSLVDYGTFLRVDASTGEVLSDCDTGRYIIERLHLNRAQILVLRCVLMQIARVEASVAEIKTLFEKNAIPAEKLKDVTDLLFRVTELQAKVARVRPYQPEDTRS